MELLWINWDMPIPLASATVAEGSDSITATLMSVDPGAVQLDYSDGRVVARRNFYMQHAFSAGGTYYFTDKDPNTTDFRDGAGHGVLYAQDRIFLQINSEFTGVQNTVYIKIYYRFKTVRLEEYVGIVQSGQ